MPDVVQKLWGFCHTLRHDGIDYGDYIEQITYLLFLKMADEKGIDLTAKANWPSLRDRSGVDLTDHKRVGRTVVCVFSDRGRTASRNRKDHR